MRLGRAVSVGVSKLTPKLALAWREALDAWARATPEMERLCLFGSRCRGDHRADSDLDLAVEVSDLTETERLGNAIRLLGNWRVTISSRIPVFVHL